MKKCKCIKSFGNFYFTDKIYDYSCINHFKNDIVFRVLCDDTVLSSLQFSDEHFHHHFIDIDDYRYNKLKELSD